MQAMAKHFKKILILYDPEPAAQLQAKKLAKELLYKGLGVEILKLHCDPGDLTAEEAHALVTTLT